MANSSNNPLKSAGSLVDEKEFASKAKVQAKRSSGAEGANAERVKLVAAMICLLAAGALIAWQLEVFGGGRGSGAVPPSATAAATQSSPTGSKDSGAVAGAAMPPEQLVLPQGAKITGKDGITYEAVRPTPGSSTPLRQP